MLSYVYDEKLGHCNESIKVREIAQDCNDLSNDSKVECVFKKVHPYYKYKNIFFVRDPDYTLKNGGNCEDWNVVYRAIFNEMKLSTKDIMTDKHVFTLVYWDKYYCIIDQDYYYCQRML